MIDPVTKMPVELVPPDQITWLREAERRHLRDDGNGWLHSMQHLISIVEQIKPNSLLDYGCSGGHFLGALKVDRKFGYDIDPYAVHKAASKGITVFSRWEDVPAVDMITVIDVIEHMVPEHVIQLLYDLRAKLPAGGMALFQTDNPRSLSAHIDFYNDYTHVRMYDAWTFINLLNLTGFGTSFFTKAISPPESQESKLHPSLSEPFMKWVVVAQKIIA